MKTIQRRKQTISQKQKILKIYSDGIKNMSFYDLELYQILLPLLSTKPIHQKLKNNIQKIQRIMINITQCCFMILYNDDQYNQMNQSQNTQVPNNNPSITTQQLPQPSQNLYQIHLVNDSPNQPQILNPISSSQQPQPKNKPTSTKQLPLDSTPTLSQPSPPTTNTDSQLIQNSSQLIQQITIKTKLQPLIKPPNQIIKPIYEQFCKAFNNIQNDISIQQSINNYSQIFTTYYHQQIFYDHFVSNQYIKLLMTKMRKHHYKQQIVKTVFGTLQHLLRSLQSQKDQNQNKHQQFIFLLLMINQQNFITQNYQFLQSQTWAYYINLLKLLVRIINQTDKQEQQISTPQKPKPLKLPTSSSTVSKYLNIFFNQKTPQFPLLLKLLRFYKCSDTIIQTSVKLCLLQLSHHKNQLLQKYLLNFPFITFYLLYCNKISDNIQKYLSISSIPSKKQSSQQQTLIQQIITDVKFMEDYLKVQQQSANFNHNLLQHKYQNQIDNIQQHLNMYINTFLYYIGRSFYQTLLKLATQQNINGIIKTILLLIKILKINTILKIKLGFQQMFHHQINCRLFQYLKSKKDKLDNDKQWLLDLCDEFVKEHALAILYGVKKGNKALQKNPSNSSPNTSKQIPTEKQPIKQHPPTNKSLTQKSKKPQNFLKKLRGFIPKTQQNHLLTQLKKISTVLGLTVSLNKQIQDYSLVSKSTHSQQLYKNSFLSIIDTIQQSHYHSNNQIMKNKKSLFSKLTSPIKSNPLFNAIITFGKNGITTQSKIAKTTFEQRSQQLVYHYLTLMCFLKGNTTTKPEPIPLQDPTIQTINKQNINIQEISQLIKLAQQCKSLLLVAIIYYYIKLLDYQLSKTNLDFLITRQSTYDVRIQQIQSIFKLKQKLHKNQSKQTKASKSKQFNTFTHTIASQLLSTYTTTMQKLVYYIMSQGWHSFIKHINFIKQVIWLKQNPNQSTKHQQQNNKTQFSEQHVPKNPITQFYNYISRDIECDIIYFIILRHIFGTRNTIQQLPQLLQTNLENQDLITNKIKISCSLSHSEDQQVYLMLDGQYIKITNLKDQPISTKSLTSTSFHQPQKSLQTQTKSSSQTPNSPKSFTSHNNYSFQLFDKNMNAQNIHIYFQQYQILQSIVKQMTQRKKIANHIQIALRSKRFDIQS